ncbi:MAG TPA: LEA type 2 family protein [Gemmatimonadales bacterium]|nr:LEA type 2 family protein [Gemmatimonadales bacterium]
MRSPWVVAAVAVVAAMTGCGPGLGADFIRPRIQLDRVIVRGVGLTGGNLDLVVNVANPNRFDLRGTRLDAGFDVEDSHVGTVTYDADYVVPKGDSTVVTLPLRFEWRGVGGAFRSALQYGDIPYTMKGQATLETPVGRQVVPFTLRGRAPLTRPGGGLPALPTVSP